MKRLGKDFFARKPEVVARELLGKLLVRKDGGEIKVGIITETEAYLGFDDKASHSHKGKTKRNEVMFGPAGFAYVYFTYGMHWLLNFITEEEGKPSGVLIRAVEPVYDAALKIENYKVENCDFNKIANGPAKLTKWMGINGTLNKEDITKSEKLFVTKEISIEKKTFKAKKITSAGIVVAPRVGVNYAGEHANLNLRFYLKDNKFVSKV